MADDFPVETRREIGANRPGGGEGQNTVMLQSGDAKAKAYTDIGQEMINDGVIVPIVNPQIVLAHAADVTGMHYSACCNLDLGLLGLKG